MWLQTTSLLTDKPSFEPSQLPKNGDSSLQRVTTDVISHPRKVAEDYCVQQRTNRDEGQDNDLTNEAVLTVPMSSGVAVMLLCAYRVIPVLPREGEQ